MKKLHVVISLPNQNSYHQEQAVTARTTAQELGVDVKILHAEDDPIKQSQQILDIVQSREKPDAILFEPLTSTGLVRAGEAAVASGIGWVVLNSDVDYLDRL